MLASVNTNCHEMFLTDLKFSDLATQIRLQGLIGHEEHTYHLGVLGFGSQPMPLLDTAGHKAH